MIALWAWRFPELRHAGELHAITSETLQGATDSEAVRESLPT